jgi:hypothetical protein
MDERNRQNFEVIENTRERVNEVSEKSVLSHHTNPIVKKLLDFSTSDKTRKFSVRDLLKR